MGEEEDFNKRLRDRMQELGVRPSDIAGAVGVSVSAVLQWIGGKTKGLKPANLVAVADMLGVEIRWLAVGQGPKEVPRSTHKPVRRIVDVALTSNRTKRKQSR